MKNYAYFKNVNLQKNHHKFYEIIENDDGSLDCRYGSIGMEHRAVHKHYSPYEKTFNTCVKERINHGYALDEEKSKPSDVVPNNSSLKNKDVEYAPIKNTYVKELIDRFIKEQKQTFSQTYSIKVEEVTKEQVERARFYVDQLAEMVNQKSLGQNVTLDDFNNILVGRNNNAYNFTTDKNCLLFAVERQRGEAKNMMAKTTDIKEWNEIYDRELKKVDALEGEYLLHQNKNKQLNTNLNINPKKRDILTENGISVEEISYKEEDMILDMLRKKNWQGLENESRYVQAFKMTNSSSKEHFDKFVKDNNIKKDDIKLLWHGSRTQNQWSLLNKGLILNSGAIRTGSAFGNGLYFATNSQKSANYTGLKANQGRSKNWVNGSAKEYGYLLLCDVVMGKSYEPTTTNSSLNERTIRAKGCLSTYAKKGIFQDDEIIVYNQNQVNVRYIVELQGDNRFKEYHINPTKLHLTNGFNEITVNNGKFTSELVLNQLSTADRDYLMNKLYLKEDDKITFEFIPEIKQEKILLNEKPLEKCNLKGVETKLTQDDLTYIFREFKKANFKGEEQFREFIDTNKDKSGVVLTNDNAKFVENKENINVKGE